MGAYEPPGCPRHRDLCVVGGEFYRLFERIVGGVEQHELLSSQSIPHDPREGVSDIVQSTCREVIENVDRFRWGGELGFRRWLYASALRQIVDKHEFHHAQTRDLARETSPAAMTRPGTGDGAMPDLGAYGASLSTPSRVTVAREEAGRIEGAFDAISDEERDLIVESRLLGVSHRELAEERGKSEGADRVALPRALVRLAAALDSTAHDSTS